MGLAGFFISVVGISLSGVMMPGPVTAAAIATGARNRWAGVLISIGHGIVEFPLMILIVLGADKLLQSMPARIVIGLGGGIFLLVMAAQMLYAVYRPGPQQAASVKRGPLMLGVVLSVGNPYFLGWWATVGLSLAMQARDIGIWAFAIFAVVHWLCDLVWLTLLSWVSFKGSVLLGGKSQRVVLTICGGTLCFFGLYFIVDAARIVIELIQTTS